MPTGRLGVADLTTTATNSVYTCPPATFAVATVSICNRGAASANIRISVSSSSTPSTTEYLEFDSELVAKGVLERTGIVMDAGKILVVSTSTSSSSLSVVVMGIETSTA